ncbi:MAG: hypothetical protein Q7S03_04085 [bacterium]|nr:hypothetical protein [bacterium]
MIQKIDAPVSVSLVFDHKLRKVFPKYVGWDGKMYLITKIGLHHTFRLGKTLCHVFSVESPALSFRLVLNTDTLHWRLEEISDGEPN